MMLLLIPPHTAVITSHGKEKADVLEKNVIYTTEYKMVEF